MGRLRILLEGRPGAGKTTVARRFALLLRERGIPTRGFFTEEIRVGGSRVGFSIETSNGERATLAHVELAGPPRVSRYGVDLEAFERIVLPVLAHGPEDELVLIDELGKMELASEAFCDAVNDLFAGSAPIVATVQLARHPFTDALKRRADVELVRVSARNRDELPDLLAGQADAGGADVA